MDFVPIPALDITALSGWGILLIQSLAVIQALRKGALVPKSTVDGMRKDFEARIGEAVTRENDSKETAKIMLAANTELLKQVGTLTGELRIVGKMAIAINPELAEVDLD